MRIANAKLIKRITSDGFVEVRDDVLLGKVYLVDLDSRKEYELFNVVFKRFHRKELILDVQESQLFPIELLEIEGEKS